MSDISERIKNGAAVSNSALYDSASDNPYAVGRNKQYFSDSTRAFNAQYAQYASDYFSAEVQGMFPDDFYTYTSCGVRMPSLVSEGITGTIVDDWKRVYFSEPQVDYIGLGAKITTATGTARENTWIVVNTDNMSSATASCVVRKCNAVWNHLDYYGNILSEPFVWQARISAETATSNDYTEFTVLPNGYQHSVMQNNSDTTDLTINSRIVLGKSVYAIRGLVDFTREFTSDAESSHILYFDLYRMEGAQQYDDMVNKVADGKSFSWQIDITGSNEMVIGQTQTLSVTSLRNGKLPDTETYPVGYNFTSSDENVVAAVSNSFLNAVGAGSCTITCSLVQNPSISTTFDITVSETSAVNYVSFNGAPPTTIAQYSNATVAATYYANGVATSDAITYTYSGANATCYGVSVNGNTISISCYYPSDTPLIVTASANGDSTSTTILLEGY